MQEIKCNENWERIVGEKPSRMNPLAGKNVSVVDLPDDFVLTLPRSADAKGGAAVGFFPGENALYTKKLEIPEECSGKSVLLDIDGAYMNAEVAVNGEVMGVHPYGYTPWQISLDDVIIPGEENVFEITTRCIQPNSRWYSGGGLYRQVSLWVGSPCHIRPWDAFFTTPEVSEEKSTLQVQVALTNTAPEDAAGTLTLSCSGEETQFDITVPAKDTVTAMITLPVHNVDLWSDLTPALYEAVLTLETNLGTDVHAQQVGFRRIEIDAKEGMRVNGRPVKLLGGCLHHDNTLLGAAAYPRAEERKLELLKEAGYNAVRCAHNPPSRTFLDTCDRLGIYVMNESFDCWKEGKKDLDYHLYFDAYWKSDLTAMVERDRNHPCIFTWSIGNEIAEVGGSSQGPTMCVPWIPHAPSPWDSTA